MCCILHFIFYTIIIVYIYWMDLIDKNQTTWTGATTYIWLTFKCTSTSFVSVNYFTRVVFITPAAGAEVEVWAVGGADTRITMSLSGFLAAAVVTWRGNVNIGSSVFMETEMQS